MIHTWNVFLVAFYLGYFYGFFPLPIEYIQRFMLVMMSQPLFWCIASSFWVSFVMHSGGGEGLKKLAGCVSPCF